MSDEKRFTAADLKKAYEEGFLDSDDSTWHESSDDTWEYSITKTKVERESTNQSENDCWIPVEKHLPDDTGRFQSSRPIDITFQCENNVRLTCRAVYIGGKFRRDDFEAKVVSNVIAWRYCIEPYQPA